MQFDLFVAEIIDEVNVLLQEAAEEARNEEIFEEWCNMMMDNLAISQFEASHWME